jgi:hypothetical protein
MGFAVVFCKNLRGSAGVTVILPKALSLGIYSKVVFEHVKMFFFYIIFPSHQIVLV